MVGKCPETDRILVAQLAGEARHHAKWRELTGDEETAGVAEFPACGRPGGVTCWPRWPVPVGTGPGPAGLDGFQVFAAAVSAQLRKPDVARGLVSV